LDNTGFEFDIPDVVPETPTPEEDRLSLLRSSVGLEVADTYPAFARDVLGVAA
jgi:glutaconate CoA-transferase subunit B